MLDIVIQLMPHIVATAIYTLLGVHFWNTRWREKEGRTVACPMRPWEQLTIGSTIAVHGYGLFQAIFSQSGMHFSFGLALSLMIWIAVLIYWLESFQARMEGMQPLVLPLAAVCSVAPVLFEQTRLVAHADDLGFKLHFSTAMLAYSLLTLAALHAIFMGFTERALHQRSLRRSLASLPPLMIMDKILFRMIFIGFLLLTVTISSGVFFSELLFQKPFSLDHKTLFAFLSWLIFATLLFGRQVWGWRGRKALRWTLAGFATLLLAYFGSRFVAEILLGKL